MNEIRTIALCVLSRGDEILVFEEIDHTKESPFARPLGGGIEFGESSADAVKREIAEELGAEIGEPELLGILENIFEYNGAAGHEIEFVFDARLKDESLYVHDRLPFTEGDVEGCAFWSSPSALAARGVRLVPEGLAELLRERRASAGAAT